jgi:hypothetical protein
MMRPAMGCYGFVASIRCEMPGLFPIGLFSIKSVRDGHEMACSSGILWHWFPLCVLRPSINVSGGEPFQFVVGAQMKEKVAERIDTDILETLAGGQKGVFHLHRASIYGNVTFFVNQFVFCTSCCLFATVSDITFDALSPLPSLPLSGWDPKGAIAGLDEAVRGMRAGGVRRVLIPPRHQ